MIRCRYFISCIKHATWILISTRFTNRQIFTLTIYFSIYSINYNFACRVAEFSAGVLSGSLFDSLLNKLFPTSLIYYSWTRTRNWFEVIYSEFGKNIEISFGNWLLKQPLFVCIKFHNWWLTRLLIFQFNKIRHESFCNS